MLRWLALVALAVAGCISVADAQQYDSSKDFDTLSAAGNNNPVDIWSDGTTMWVADTLDGQIYAYHMSNKTRDNMNDFTRTTLTGAGNSRPSGIWSDGTTMWVADTLDDKIYAYHMSNKTRDSNNDFDTLSAAGNTDPVGMWSDDATMWVTDTGDDKIYAYHMSNKTRDSNNDFDTLSAAGNTVPGGMWSDDATMWVTDWDDDKIYAYSMSSKARDSNNDFDTLSAAGNTVPGGMWSDDATMWVVDSGVDKIYAYKMHPPPAPPPAPTVSPPRTFVIPPDTTPPTVKSVERTGNATTTNHTLIWNVRFSESVHVRPVDIHTNYTSIVNATIPDLGTVSDTILVDIPGTVTRGSVSVDLEHFITGGLLIQLVAPDCTKFTIHNQTTTFPYKLRQPYNLGDLSGVGAAGQWELHVSDHAKYWNGTLNGWTLYLESRGAVEGGGRDYTITQYVAGPGEYALSLDGYDIRDWAGNRLKYTEPAVNEPYHMVGAAVRTC